jgi:hypothetical protein
MNCRYSALITNQANMPAAHSTPTTLAPETLRRRNRRSGISGSDTRASMSRNTISNATAPPSCDSVFTDVQPAALPPTTAYTASIMPSVTVTAPGMSRRRGAPDGASTGSNFRHAKYTATPIGRLTRKTDSQPSQLVRKPPSTSPMLPPAAQTKP